jgi:hypothetical protein
MNEEMPGLSIGQAWTSRGRMTLLQERAGAPFERVALDLIGPLPPSRRGKVYLLVMQDCYTKWVETAPLANKTAPVVAEAYANTSVARCGAPRLLHQDNGSEFTADVFVELCICTDTGWDWADASPWQQAPNRIVFGREAALPLDTIFGKANEMPSCCTVVANHLAIRPHDCQTSHGTKVTCTKRYFDRRVDERQFAISDSVLWLRPHRTKLQNVRQGPYKIVDRALAWHTYTLEREGKRRRARASQLYN